MRSDFISHLPFTLHTSFLYTLPQAAAFPITDYNYKEVQTTFRAVRVRRPHADIRIGLFFPRSALWKLFLQITEDEIDRVADTHIKAAFAFSREGITAFQDQALDERVVSCARLQRPTTMPNSTSRPPRHSNTGSRKKRII